LILRKWQSARAYPSRPCSRTLNRPELVLESTRKRILDTIEEMDYVPNPSAMSLSTGRTGTIACVVPTLRNEFFNQLVEGCQRILAYSGYKLLIYSAANSGVFLERLDQRSIDGIILSGSNYTRENRANLDILQVPCVLIENAEQFADFRELPPTVYIEDYDGVQFALKYLYAEGNRCFGILAGDQDYIVTQRGFVLSGNSSPGCRIASITWSTRGIPILAKRRRRVCLF
jgi:DNA-binding LacI/PurR family transcriptional regulator